MTLHIQKILRENGGVVPEDLQVKATPSKVYPNLVLFKYTRANPPFSNPAVRECRGLILDKDRDWAIVSHPFSKFFNYGEPQAAEIDWSSARVHEKLDGSLICLYWYDGGWRIQTSGTPDGDAPVMDFGVTYRDLFMMTLEEMGLDLPPSEARYLTFIFELTSPINHIVVRYEKSSITLLGARATESGMDFTPREIVGMNRMPAYPCPREFLFSDLSETIACARAIVSLSMEGFVVRDRRANRVKIKSPDYVAAHALRGEGAMSMRRMVELIRAGNIDDVLALYPEWRPMFLDVCSRYRVVETAIKQDWENAIHDKGQKEFALSVRHALCSKALFSMRKDPTLSIADCLGRMPLKSLVELLLRGESI